MPGIALAGNLPADGSTHGFDKHPEALDISHVNVAKYLEATDHILDDAIATAASAESEPFVGVAGGALWGAAAAQALAAEPRRPRPQLRASSRRPMWPQKSP